MAFQSCNNVSIDAIVCCVPSKVVTTESYTLISKEEQELFIRTTGIKERRVANNETTCSDLCFKAAKDILDKYDCKNEIELLVFVSQSPDYFLPATSIILQDKLGIPKTCLAFDVNLGCSGYVYGLSIVSNMLQSGQLKKALLLVGDKSTISTAYTDKSTYPLFGDAGTATLLSYKPGSNPWYFNLQSDGTGQKAIIIEHGHSRNPYSEESNIELTIEKGIVRTKKHLALDGMEIFNFALKEAAPNIRQLLNNAEFSIENIDFIVLHQANKLINESIRKKLKIDLEKVPYSIDCFGNTSSASIPLTICYQLKEQIMNKKLTLLLAGFGVGFSWGSMICEVENVYTNLLNYD